MNFIWLVNVKLWPRNVGWCWKINLPYRLYPKKFFIASCMFAYTTSFCEFIYGVVPLPVSVWRIIDLFHFFFFLLLPAPNHLGSQKNPSSFIDFSLINCDFFLPQMLHKPLIICLPFLVRMCCGFRDSVCFLHFTQ